MKLAFCLFKYFPYGGLQRDFLRIAKECYQRGHEIHVYAMAWEGEIPSTFHLHLIPSKGIQNHSRSHSFIKKVKAELDREHYDCVIGFNKMPYLDIYYAADVCYRARAAKKHHYFYRLLPRYRKLVKLEKSVFARNHQTQILLLSPLMQEEYIHNYQTQAERFHLLPPGIEKERLTFDNPLEMRRLFREKHRLSEDHILLLMVGSGFKTKGLDRAIHGLASLPPALKKRTQLYVLGQDNPASFQNLAAKLKVSDHIRFLGGRDDVPNFLQAADLLVHPAYHENTGTVLLEALVSGLPVLTVDVCGYAHYISDAKAGMVLPSPFEQEAFNTALQKMILSSEQALWRQNGMAFAKSADLYSNTETAVTWIEQTKKSSETTPFFERMMTMSGTCFREQKGRFTKRVTLNEQSYFIKQHTGVSVKEVLKNVTQLKWPVVSAKNEWQAIKKLHALDILVPTVASFEARGLHPFHAQSYILMEEIAPAISLEELSHNWQHCPPSFAFKKMLIKEVARIARTLHVNGVNHRDFYLCHFLLNTSQMEKNKIALYLIDLHRAQIRRLLPKRWVLKDLAGLYFSSKHIALTKRDLFRFMKSYRQKSLRELLHTEKKFWQQVKIRGDQLP